MLRRLHRLQTTKYKATAKQIAGSVLNLGKTDILNNALFTLQIRPADLLKPEFDVMKEEVKQYVEDASVEDVLTYAMFPKVAPKFFEKRRDRQVGIDADHADKTNKVHPV